MYYKVTIERVETGEKPTRDWRELYSDESYQLMMERGLDTKEQPQYGYVSGSKETNEATELYSQKVLELDIQEVIRAVNGMQQILEVSSTELDRESIN